MEKFLSKSDFKVAQTCPTKLFYKKKGYPSSTEENEYLQMLADGGYMVGKMAQLLYPNGIEITTEKGTSQAIIDSDNFLMEEHITLFEPAIYSKNKLIRIDILEKNKDTFKLIEVKSKSFDSLEYQEKKSQGKKYFETSEWKEYIEDITFQKYVLSEKFPSAKIEAYLLMPDKSKTTPIEGLIDWFKLRKEEFSKTKSFRKTEVDFSGNLNELMTGHILEWVNVDEYISLAMNEIKQNSKIYIQSILDDKRLIEPLSCNCKSCEFTIKRDETSQSGFEECWGELAKVKPHILELGQLGNINKTREKHIDSLIKQKKVSLNDVPLEIIENKYNNRPFYQITQKSEFLLKEISDEMDNCVCPLHFIDFETSQMAVPYHAGMRPYGKVIFQWSCHTIYKQGDMPTHKEWINTTDKFPNFEFALALKDAIGDHGTILIWSLYENTMLKDVLKSFEFFEYQDHKLKEWLLHTIQFDKDQPTRLLDMNNLTKQYYFHPNMGGRTSIKVTLPSVLKASKSEKIKSMLSDLNLYAMEDDGTIKDPYKLLPKVKIDDIEIDVSNGTDAMYAYQEMLYGVNKENQKVKDSYKKVLLEYCKLDTLAMVIIWQHWLELLENKNQ